MFARCVAVAYSGGRDSTALLHATLCAAREQGLGVVALHVHHGLSPHADAWLEHCERQCRRWAAKGLPVCLDHRRIDAAPAAGDSVEAWARRARFAALREMAIARGAPLVLLAHHRRDQAETLLLQALRGAGVAGLAAMPAAVVRDGLTWVRPWLGVDPEDVAAYVRRHRLGHVVDDSNADPRFARNRLRLQVWPALAAAFPQAEASLAAAATWAGDAKQCADALATIDLAAVADARGIDLAVWQALPAARASNALRAWLRARTGAPAPAALIRRLIDELPRRGPARWSIGRFELRRYRARLECRETVALPTALQAVKAARLEVPRAGTYELAGWGGRLRARRVAEGGVALSSLATVRLVERSGGEQFQGAPGRPARSLKKQFQAAALPAWLRDGPLLYLGEHLLFVPGLGIDARARAAPGVPQVSLEWLRHDD